MKNNSFIALLEQRLLFASIGRTDTVADSPVPISGIVFADTVAKNNAPDPGEGVADCIVTFNNNADHSVSTPITAADGSYSTDLYPGTYDVQVVGPTTAGNYDFPNIVIGAQPTTFNAKVDLAHSGGGGGGGGNSATPADLAVTISNLPSTLAPNATKAPVTVTVSNSGGAYKGPISATVYFSTDKTIDATDPHLPTLSLPTVKIGSKPKTLAFNAASLAGVIPAGDFYVLVQIDATGDSNSANNIAFSSSQTQVLPSSTNLVPSFKGKLKVSKSHTLPFNLVVTNTGSATATGPMTIALAARSTNGGADIPLPLLGPISINIGSDDHMTFKQSADVTSLAAGSYDLVLTISAAVTPAESSTTDNVVLSSRFIVK